MDFRSRKSEGRNTLPHGGMGDDTPALSRPNVPSDARARNHPPDASSSDSDGGDTQRRRQHYERTIPSRHRNSNAIIAQQAATQRDPVPGRTHAGHPEVSETPSNTGMVIESRPQLIVTMVADNSLSI
jgi:hypothetical protein